MQLTHTGLHLLAALDFKKGNVVPGVRALLPALVAPPPSHPR